MKKALKAGIFVFIILVILILGWIWLSNIEFHTTKQIVIVHFPDVTGLKVNDPVKVWGVEKGEVKKIEFAKEYIKVELAVDKDVNIYTDAKAYILDIAMISGTKYVNLDPGKSGIKLPQGQPIPGEGSVGLPMALLGQVGQRLNELLTLVNIKETFERLNDAIKSLQKTADELTNAIRENKGEVTKTINEIKTTTNRINETASNIEEITRKVENGEGTIGKLLSNDSLYNELVATTVSLRKLIEDIQSNPKKYIKIF